MSDVTSVVKEITLDLTDIPRAKHAEVKKEVGDFVINEILRHLDKGVSPVRGEGRFKILNPEYAEKEKRGVRTANLQLDGDLVDALRARDLGGSRIEIGIRGSQAPKADGHNQLSGEAKAWALQKNFPKRRFIPDSFQSFNDTIKKGIDDILSSERKPRTLLDVEVPDESSVLSEVSTPNEVRIESSNLFDEDVIELLLARRLSNNDF